MTEKLLVELSQLEQVESIALGGSRSGRNYDEKSDYDVYVYCNSPVSEETRTDILKKYCCTMEIGNHYWEYEDNCTLNNGFTGKFQMLWKIIIHATDTQLVCGTILLIAG